MKYCNKCETHNNLCDSVMCHVAFEAPKSPVEAKKDTSGKPDLSLIPIEFLEMTALAFMDGETKYGRDNYFIGMPWLKIAAAVTRHIFKWMRGEDYAPDSKVHHLGHAGAGLAMLAVYSIHKLGTDNRKKL